MAEVQIQPTEAVTCFTGCVTRIVRRECEAFREGHLLSFGSGYQLRSGFDEYGYPEIIFDVLKTCEVSLSLLGGSCTKEYVLQNEGWFYQILAALIAKGQVIVWLNSSFLNYSETFFQRPPYLHAILLEGYDETLEEFSIYDSLLFDHGRKSIETCVSKSVIGNGLTTLISGNELAPELGTFYTIDSPTIDVSMLNIGQQVRRQAEENVSNQLHSSVIDEYARLCLKSLSSSDLDQKHAARRLFDHISTFFVLPSLQLLQKDLTLASFSDQVVKKAKELEMRWRHLAVLALKYEVTLNQMLLPRIEAKFKEIENLHSTLWRELAGSF